MSADLPISVWPVAQRSPRAQRTGRYTKESVTHPAKMLPAIAARAIEIYTTPGDLVMDPMCGIGTTLVEAVHLGRDAVGIEYEASWAKLARKNLALARRQGAKGCGRVVTGDARSMTRLLDPCDLGRVALIVTSPPYGASLHGQVKTGTGGIQKSHNRYSRDRKNLAHIGHTGLLDASALIMADCATVLRPGGFIVMTVRPYRQTGMLVDLPGELVVVGEHMGLVLYERNIALLAGLRDDELVPRASFFSLQQVREARAKGKRQHVISHEDLLIFRKPK